MHEGRVSLRLGLAGRPPLAEDVIVGRDILLAAATGAHLHIAHISSRGSVEMVREARRKRVNVTCEVTPHHLALTDEAVGDYDTLAKVNPPLRDEEIRRALVAAVADGTVDAIASDHAPHGPLDKDVEFNQAASGMIGLETVLPLCLEVLVRGGVIGIPRLVHLLSTSPARLVGVPGGSLGVGSCADVAVFDEKAEWVLDVRKLVSKSKNTPLNGRRMTGRVVHTIVGGILVVREGEVTV
jgi:dihydroorotase